AAIQASPRPGPPAVGFASGRRRTASPPAAGADRSCRGGRETHEGDRAARGRNFQRKREARKSEVCRARSRRGGRGGQGAHRRERRKPRKASATARQAPAALTAVPL